MEKEKVLFTLGWRLFYKILYLIFIIVCIPFAIGGWEYGVYLCNIIASAGAIFFAGALIQTFREKIEFTEHTIIQYKLFGKKKVYNWDDLKNVSWTTGGTAEYLNLNFKNGDKVLVNNMWNNYYLLEMELEKRHAKWK